VDQSSSFYLHYGMTLIADFLGTLAVAGKSFQEFQEKVKDAYGDKAIKRTQIYNTEEAEGERTGCGSATSELQKKKEWPSINH
jgi:hypothetical protein